MYLTDNPVILSKIFLQIFSTIDKRDPCKMLTSTECTCERVTWISVLDIFEKVFACLLVDQLCLADWVFPTHPKLQLYTHY